jgi:hypothetical protein
LQEKVRLGREWLRLAAAAAAAAVVDDDGVAAVWRRLEVAAAREQAQVW